MDFVGSWGTSLFARDNFTHVAVLGPFIRRGFRLGIHRDILFVDIGI